MIVVSFLYPNTEQARFDAAYYVEKHVPLALGLLGDAVRGLIVETGTGATAWRIRFGAAARISRIIRSGDAMFTDHTRETAPADSQTQIDVSLTTFGFLPKLASER